MEMLHEVLQWVAWFMVLRWFIVGRKETGADLASLHTLTRSLQDQITRLNGQLDEIQRRVAALVQITPLPSFTGTIVPVSGLSDFLDRDALIAVKIGERWGVIDPTGQVIIKPQFQVLGELREGTAEVLDTRGRKGVIDRSGEYRIHPNFAWFDTLPFAEGLAGARVGGWWGYMNEIGVFAIKAQFDGVHSFRDGRAGVGVGHKWGYIDKSGKLMIKPQFEDVGSFSDGVAPVKAGGKWGLLNKSGNFVLDPSWDEMDDFTDGVVRVNVSREAFIDRASFRGVEKPIEQEEFSLCLYSVLDRSGRSILPEEYLDVQILTGRLFAVMVNSRWGVIDRLGRYFVNPEFHGVKFITEDSFAVRDNRGWGVIDRSGTFLIDPQFDDLIPFGTDLFSVKAEIPDKWGIIDKSGRFIVKPIFDGILRWC